MKYYLFDLEIETIGDPKTFNCSHTVGEGLVVKGENMSFKPGTKQFSHYALSSLFPYIAAKQRADQETDWMFFETDIACPDPECGARFRFKLGGKQEYEYQ
jgi:uncharacterized repeat protein (TIGR04076 family)